MYLLYMIVELLTSSASSAPSSAPPGRRPLIPAAAKVPGMGAIVHLADVNIAAVGAGQAATRQVTNAQPIVLSYIDKQIH